MSIESNFPRKIATSVNLEKFDKVIRTQAEFEVLIASADWLGATSVCFVGNGGEFKFTRSDGKGCLIPRSVKQIQGVDNATIEITNFAQNESVNKAALWYEVLPTGEGYSIRDIAVSCEGKSQVCGFINCTQLTNCTGSGTSMFDVGARIFVSCTQLTNCTGSGTNTGTVTRWPPYAFYKCTQLTNCTGASTGPSDAFAFYQCTQLANCTGTATSTAGVGRAFIDCKQLINCSGTGASGHQIYVFVSCTQLTSCTGAGAADNLAIAFHSCTQLTNCTGTMTGPSNTYAFHSCTQLTNCTGSGTSAVAAYAFNTCTQLTNCTGSGTNTGGRQASAFYQCTQLTNCTGTGTTTTPTGNGYSFYFCHYLNGCKQGDTASTTAFLGGPNTKIDTLTVAAT